METVHNWIMDENIETLIEEVEKRPAIYNKTLKEYANINIEKQLCCCYTELEQFGRGR
jgi:hypothetical protein